MAGFEGSMEFNIALTLHDALLHARVFSILVNCVLLSVVHI